jgi:hypothetical protein
LGAVASSGSDPAIGTNRALLKRLVMEKGLRSRCGPWRALALRLRCEGLTRSTAMDRFNVATSAARLATVVVASPQFFAAQCERAEQMWMVSAFVRYGEISGGVE